jgi:FMN phosphatase YigB (HAD superfamily)
MKPEEGYFQAVTKLLGVPPSKVLFIDDQNHYLTAAATHGWKTVLFRESAATAAHDLGSALSRAAGKAYRRSSQPSRLQNRS